MPFKLLYSIYVIVCILFSQYNLVGGLSLRHVLTVVMLLLCIKEKGIVFDRFLSLFCGFLFFYGISCFITGYETIFIRRLIGTFSAAFVLYWSSRIMILHYNAFNWVINTVLIIAVINSIIAIGQFYGNPIARGISTFFEFNLGEDLVDLYQTRDDFHGRYVSGIMDIVLNGYFLSASCILALYNKKGVPSILNWTIFIIIFFALFLCQERAGFYCAIICLFIYYVVTGKNNKIQVFSLFIIAILLLFVILNYGEQLFSFGEMRYSTVSDEGLRGDLIINGFSYFLNHPLGALHQWIDEGNIQAHNVFINALLMGGIFGGLIAIAIIIAQLSKIAVVLLDSMRKHRNSLCLIMVAIVYLDYMLNSFFHNPSFLDGNAMYFILWGLFTSLLKPHSSSKNNMNIAIQ